ncbi:MAG: hypothetical protein OXU61_08140 [Gammaproteobacteria bacterium]|nr:hypothetical protein [Gammaproteobacteria bacterium]
MAAKKVPARQGLHIGLHIGKIYAQYVGDGADFQRDMGIAPQSTSIEFSKNMKL